jgi:hypothetical protein
MRITLLTAALALTVPAAAAVAAPPANFRTPSGNIGCDMRASGTRCDILRYSYTPPRRPASCPLEWGDALEVTRRARARFVCHGDTVLPPPGRRNTVAYGTTIRRGGVTCRVTRAGVTCRNARGQGFFLSRERVRILPATR